MFKSYLFLFLFASDGFARISPFPNDFMPLSSVCRDLDSSEIIVEIYEKSEESKAWAGFITDAGEEGLISVVQVEDGFKTKNGELNKFRLSLQEESVYEVSLHVAKIDGSNGEPIIAPKRVLCLNPDN